MISSLGWTFVRLHTASSWTSCSSNFFLTMHDTANLACPLGVWGCRASLRDRIFHAFCHGRPCNSHRRRKPKRKGTRCQAIDKQYSNNLQNFSQWIIGAGVDGIHGDSQRVELYQYGHDGRGLRATSVRSYSRFLHLLLKSLTLQNACFFLMVSV